MAISVRTAIEFGLAGANPAAQNITTQGTDKAVILAGSNWEGGLFTTTSLNGDTTPDGTASQTDAGSDESAHVVVWLNPALGTISLDWAWAAAPSDGGEIWVVIVQCDGTISFIDADADASGSTTSVTSTSAVGDLCVAVGFQFDAAASVGGAYVVGDAVAADDVFNGQHGRPYARAATGVTTNATSQLGVVQVILRETGGASPSVNNDTSRSRGVRSLTGVGLKPRSKPVRKGAIWVYEGAGA